MVGFPVSDTTAVCKELFEKFLGKSDDGRVFCFRHYGNLLEALRKVPRTALKWRGSLF